MIINENNKNTILKGSIQRGFNQDASNLRQKLQEQLSKGNQDKVIKPEVKPNNFRETLTNFRNLK